MYEYKESIILLFDLHGISLPMHLIKKKVSCSNLNPLRLDSSPIISFHSSSCLNLCALLSHQRWRDLAGKFICERVVE